MAHNKVRSAFAGLSVFNIASCITLHGRTFVWVHLQSTELGTCATGAASDDPVGSVAMSEVTLVLDSASCVKFSRRHPRLNCPIFMPRLSEAGGPRQRPQN